MKNLISKLCRSPKLSKYNEQDFSINFENLGLPIAISNENILPDWDPLESWETYFETIKDLYDSSPSLRSLIKAVMLKSTSRRISREKHRSAIQKWVDTNVKGITLVWPEQLLEIYNSVRSSDVPPIYAFWWGKDGEGSIPDIIYHTLLDHGYLPVANDHDLIGHLQIFSIPEIKSSTLKIANGFRRLLEHEARIKSYLEISGSQNTNSRTRNMGNAAGLFTKAWNVIQEKIYIQIKSKNTGQKAKLAMLGAFNTTYGPILSTRLPERYLLASASGLGFFSNQPHRSIIPSANEAKELIPNFEQIKNLEIRHELQSKFDTALNQFLNAWSTLEFSQEHRSNPTSFLFDRWNNIIKESLFLTDSVSGERLSLAIRWEKLSEIVLQDPHFRHICSQETLFKFAEAIISLATQLTDYEINLKNYLNSPGVQNEVKEAK